jgi:hypothetical protein
MQVLYREGYGNYILSEREAWDDPEGDGSASYWNTKKGKSWREIVT